VVLVLVAAAVTVGVLVRRPLPVHSGSLSIAALDSEVTVLRDARDVPTIVASSAHDLFLAQGYTDAQDRFFVMDYRRHVASGTLSELVGSNPVALKADEAVRTMGWRQVAESEWELLKPATRQYLQAYADGVNAYLAGRTASQVAVEYTILGTQITVGPPEPWDPIDSLVWLKAMAWDLRSNYDSEVARAQAYEIIRDAGQVDQLFPAYPADLNAPIITGASAETAASAQTDPVSAVVTVPEVQDALASASAAVEAVPHLVGADDGVGSNSWAVSGARTSTGLPLLANDPHLGLTQPGVWSQVGLRCTEVSADCPFDMTGFSFAGFPGVIIGHNTTLAWGLTNLGADVSDFFLERLVGDSALVDGVGEPMTIRTEEIKVADAPSVEIEVRATRHGPIVSDVLDIDGVGSVPASGTGGTYQVALQWTGLIPGRTADAVFALDTAEDAADVASAAAQFEVPSQNIVFATTDGHIGYQAPGKIPVRADIVGSPLPSDGTWPRPGWDSAYDWQGFVDPGEMPSVLDPAEGFIVAANQEVSTTGPYLSDDWDYGYRSQRIRDLLTEQIEEGPLDVPGMEAIAADTHAAAADILVPALLQIDIGDGFDADGQTLLRTWDRNMDAGSPAAMYFAAVWKDVLQQTFADELPEGAELTGSSRSVELIRRIIDEPSSPWWDDQSTPQVVEGRDEILSDALVHARRELTAQLGSDIDSWRWGTLHRADLRHLVLGGDQLPTPITWFMNPDALPVPGGSSVVDATSWNAASGSYTVTSGPSMRMVVDLSDLDSSTWVNLTGQSGHPGSEHYTDQLAAWADCEYYPWPFTPVAVKADAVTTLTLRP
jgi:penicillin G amidase